MGPDLKTNANVDKPLILALSGCAVPPSFATTHPIPWPPQEITFGDDGLVVVLALEQLRLLFADDEKLLILGLEQADANGQVDAHAPELHTARVGAIEPISHHDHHKVNM